LCEDYHDYPSNDYYTNTRIKNDPPNRLEVKYMCKSCGTAYKLYLYYN
jgi:hypothetical protein